MMLIPLEGAAGRAVGRRLPTTQAGCFIGSMWLLPGQVDLFVVSGLREKDFERYCVSDVVILIILENICK